MIENLPDDVNSNIHKAMLIFIKNTREEKDLSQVALGILYLLTSLYSKFEDSNWKEILLKHVKQHVDEV